MMDSYLKQVEDRAKMGIPALPLSAEFTAEVCKMLEKRRYG